MELCSEPENALVNNNDLKNMQDGEKEENCEVSSTNERKSISVKRESTTDEESDLNCSIVQDQATDTPDNSLKITFKLGKKEKSEKKKTKNKNKSKHNSAVEKIGKLIIKDTHGEYSIKSTSKESPAESASMPEENERLPGKDEEVDTNKSDVEIENNSSAQVSDTSDLKQDSSNLETNTSLDETRGSTQLINDSGDGSVVNNANEDNSDSAKPCDSKIKRKSEQETHDPSATILSKNDEKTETEDCTKEITPRTKRRKKSKANSESSELSTSDGTALNHFDSLESKESTKSTLVESSTSKRALNTSEDELEPKPKKLKTETSERICDSVGEKSRIEDISSDSMLGKETSISSLSIEIPEEKAKSSSLTPNSQVQSKLEEKSPTQKSPRDAKKITLQDFLKELNEESKNIKEGDEIPDNDDDTEMSNDVGCVIVKEGEKSEVDELSDKECDNVEKESNVREKEILTNSDPKEIDESFEKEELVNKTKEDDLESSIEVPSEDIESGKEEDAGSTNKINNDMKEENKLGQSKQENVEELKRDEIVPSKEIVNHKLDNAKDEIEAMQCDEPSDKENKSKDRIESSPVKSEEATKTKEKLESPVSASKPETAKESDGSKKPKSSKPGDLSSADSSESSDGSNSSDESSSDSDSSDSDSSSDSESGSDSSDSDSTDTEKKSKVPEPTVSHPKKLKIRNAPSLSQDSVHKSDSSMSNQDLEKPLKPVDQDIIKIAAKPVESLSRQILAGSTGTTPIVKKKRGRPRKNPLPEPVVTSQDEMKIEVETEQVEIKTEPPDDIVPDNTVVSIVNTEEEVPQPKKRGRKPGFKPARKAGRKPGRKPGRKRKVGRPRKKYYEEYKQQKELMKQEEAVLALTIEQKPMEVIPNPVVVKRPRGRPKKIKDPPASTSIVNVNDTYLPQDALSEQLLQLNSQLNLMVNNIPGAEDQNSNEITDNRLLEEINSGLDVITEEIVSEDVSNYLGNPLDEILQFQEPKKEIKVENDDDLDNYDDMSIYDQKPVARKPGRPPKHPKPPRILKSDDPDYHKKYYKYVKIPKDQQKKRGPKKRPSTETKPERKKRFPGRRPGRPRKRDLGAVERREERQSDVDSDHPYDESLSKELESVNRSMENILTECNDDKDFTVAHLKFEQLSEDQLKRSNRPKKSDMGMFSDFDNQIDELIEMTANETPRPKYRYYERIPKHLQKKRGRPRKSDNPDAPPRPPKPKKEKPPKPKKMIKVKKMVTDPETGEEKEVEVEEEVEDEEEYLDFDEDEYEEDIDDEDKDKDFDIGDYLKKEKNGINDRIEYEEVYPTKEKLFKPRKTLKSFKSLQRAQHHARFNRFGKFGNKIRNMMPARRSVNACDFRYVTVCDADYNPVAKVQRMYCVKVAPATYDIAERYKPRVKVRNLDEDDVCEFFDKYWCDQCEISFLETRINKRRHEYIFHTEEIECDLCDRTVSNRYNLRKHREIFHQKKVYTCKICEEEYKKFRTFQMHVWESHPDVRGKYRAYFCNICQTVFYRRASFKFHYHEHLNGNIFAQFDTSLSDIEFLLKQLMY